MRGGQGEGARRDQLFPGPGATIALKRTLPAITDASGLTIFGGETAKIVVSGDNKVRVLVVKKDAPYAAQHHDRERLGARGWLRHDRRRRSQPRRHPKGGT